MSLAPAKSDGLLAQGTPCLIGSPAPFKIDRNFPGILAKYYPVLRPSDLTGYEVVKLYNAISFAMWQFGPSAIPNCHIVILWATLGVTDHEHAARLLGEYLNRCQKWAVVGLPETPRRRRRARTGEGFVFDMSMCMKMARSTASIRIFSARCPRRRCRSSRLGPALF